jgi:hypothetical protein
VLAAERVVLADVWSVGWQIGGTAGDYICTNEASTPELLAMALENTPAEEMAAAMEVRNTKCAQKGLV